MRTLAARSAGIGHVQSRGSSSAKRQDGARDWAALMGLARTLPVCGWCNHMVETGLAIYRLVEIDAVVQGHGQ